MQWGCCPVGVVKEEPRGAGQMGPMRELDEARRCAGECQAAVGSPPPNSCSPLPRPVFCRHLDWCVLWHPDAVRARRGRRATVGWADPPTPPETKQLLREGSGGAEQVRQEGGSAAAGGTGVATAPARARAMRGDGAAGLWMLRPTMPRGACVCMLRQLISLILLVAEMVARAYDIIAS